jgi:hypothetical protein
MGSRLSIRAAPHHVGDKVFRKRSGRLPEKLRVVLPVVCVCGSEHDKLEEPPVESPPGLRVSSLPRCHLSPASGAPVCAATMGSARGARHRNQLLAKSWPPKAPRSHRSETPGPRHHHHDRTRNSRSDPVGRCRSSGSCLRGRARGSDRQTMPVRRVARGPYSDVQPPQ